MAEFTVNPNRVDPYKNFKFRIKWENRYVAGVNKFSGLRRATEVISHREGGDPSTSHKSPGRTEYDAIILERGVTHDQEFEKWANKVYNLGAAQARKFAQEFSQRYYFELYNEAGQLVMAYKIYRCWISEYKVLPDLDANATRLPLNISRLKMKAGNAIST